MNRTHPFPIQAGWRRGDPVEALLTREWLVTNALGGYASGTIGGAATRRFHGTLIAALPAPFARTMMLNHLEESLTVDGRCIRLSGDEGSERDVRYPDDGVLEEFVLEQGLPVWRYSHGDVRLEKRMVMPHLQNTTWITWHLLEGASEVELELRPALKFRPHEGSLTDDPPDSWRVETRDGQIEISDGSELPPLRIALHGRATLERDERLIRHFLYRIERSRGYDYQGPLWSPGTIRFRLSPGVGCALGASTESWHVIEAMTPEVSFESEASRRERLLSMSGRAASDGFGAQLVLAADQFLIRPQTRAGDQARANAAGDESRTVIAGYHWFTDWGRDTMISLEGLTLVTGRYREAGNILRTFASYIRDGLIPNLFPEGENAGLYHTADATLWFFHAVRRYVDYTGDRVTMRALLPQLVDIIEHHLRGTHFNIHVDPEDGLLTQGADGYQLTWMDAKVDGWVVTPRRGKAVEINALFYNALRILEQFLREEGRGSDADRIEAIASNVFLSFNRRFWNEEGQYLYDVVDAEGGGNDAALRPNQIFAIALDHPALERDRWKSVVHAVERALLTPVGLRSLSREHRDYKAAYDGDLRARDAAYHQGTVWGWLIGPFVDAWLKVHGDDRQEALRLLDGFRPHLSEACVGSISEVFDAEEPFYPRGCAAQAWSVAEALRCLHKLR